MSDERDGSNGDGGPPPQDIPPAAAPPPMAAAPPPEAPPPLAGQPVQPAKPFLSPAAIVAILFGLVIVVLAVLYFTGVLDRSPRQAEQTPVVGAPPAPAPSTGGDGLMGPGPGEPLNPPCDNVRNARDVAGSSPREGEQRNLLAVTAGGTYLWNGAEVDAVRLRQYLDIVSSRAPTPVTVVQVDPGAPPAAVEELRETIGRALRCEFRPT